jgi:hypothetical protein
MEVEQFDFYGNSAPWIKEEFRLSLLTPSADNGIQEVSDLAAVR